MGRVVKGPARVLLRTALALGAAALLADGATAELDPEAAALAVEGALFTSSVSAPHSTAEPLGATGRTSGLGARAAVVVAAVVVAFASSELALPAATGGLPFSPPTASTTHTMASALSAPSKRGARFRRQNPPVGGSATASGLLNDRGAAVALPATLTGFPYCAGNGFETDPGGTGIVGIWGPTPGAPVVDASGRMDVPLGSG